MIENDRTNAYSAVNTFSEEQRQRQVQKALAELPSLVRGAHESFDPVVRVFVLDAGSYEGSCSGIADIRSEAYEKAIGQLRVQGYDPTIREFSRPCSTDGVTAVREKDGRIREMPCYGVFIRVQQEYFPEDARPIDFSTLSSSANVDTQDSDLQLSSLGIKLRDFVRRFMGEKGAS